MLLTFTSIVVNSRKKTLKCFKYPTDSNLYVNVDDVPFDDDLKQRFNLWIAINKLDNKPLKKDTIDLFLSDI